MKDFKNYIRIQMKRVLRALPAILIPTILLAGIVALFFLTIRGIDEDAADKKIVEIALVGDLSDPYLKLSIYVLEHLDPIHYTVKFLPMSEKEAVQKLDRGQITAYAVIPEGLVESVMRGENKKITYVTAGGSAEMVSILIRELMESMSTILVETQNSVYGMQRFLREYGMEDQLQQATEEFDLRYVNLFLDRAEVCEVQEVGLANELSLQGYYVCGMLLLFLMLWGIACSPLFAKEDLTFQKFLLARGQKLWIQVAGEYAAYLTLMAVSVFIIAVILTAGLYFTELPVPEWEKGGSGRLLFLVVQTIPVMALLSAFQLFLFELVSGIVNGVLVQFLSAVCMGYLSGCFYPVSFLPEGMQRISAFLPSGMSLKYLSVCMAGQEKALLYLIGMGMSLFLFLWLTMLVRKRKLMKN